MSFGNRFLFGEICVVRSHSYINSAKAILQAYNGSIPFAIWLKNYFREHKKFGSKDRKTVAHLCYCYYRLGKAFSLFSVEEKLLVGQFLCSENPTIIIDELQPEWKAWMQLSIDEKLKKLNAEDELQNIFPFGKYLSDEINKTAFYQSFLIQPDLFLRIRPGKKQSVFEKLENAGLHFVPEAEDCIRLSNNSRIDTVLNIDEEVVVQDLNSQKVFNQLPVLNLPFPTTIWDCCAASGGKSILAYDIFKNIALTVSDVRPSILFNLKKRFEKAGIKRYRSFVADLSLSNVKSQISGFDLIICDAPCSGSGTWARTPEQLFFFKEEKIDHYATLQKNIAANAARHLKPQGYFLYITCSVFKKENEEVVAFLNNHSSLQLISANYYKGHTQKADTLFAALFTV